MIRRSETVFNIGDRGRQTCALVYGSGSSVSVYPGITYVNDGTRELTCRVESTITKTVSGLSADTQYFIYLKSSNKIVIGSSDIEYSTSIPTNDVSRHGYYHSTNSNWRCIGFFRSNASNLVSPFYYQGMEFQFKSPFNILNQGTSINTSLDVDGKVPMGGMTAILYYGCDRASTNTSPTLRARSGSESITLGYLTSTITNLYGIEMTPTDGSGYFTIMASAAFGAGFNLNGCLIPRRIYNL